MILSWILVILDLLRSFWDLFFNHTNWVHVQKIGCIEGSKPLGEIGRKTLSSAWGPKDATNPSAVDPVVITDDARRMSFFFAHLRIEVP